MIAADTVGTFALSLNMENYSVMTAYTMTFMVLGYLCGIASIPKVFSQEQSLRLSPLLGIVILISDPHSYWIANAIVWPLALSGLGNLTNTASGLLIMGISGGTILPLLWGYLSETSFGMHNTYMILIPCYLYILLYAMKGYRLKRKS
ncbi:hypothetical protein [Shewanella surugensis]|uniref:MFS transporter n=1 Tax=Shewanella surugensis TaxID=212020 RepID=A0ABT0LD32_9GAMM|nr:hypothetical protein [Shewanella surugensis]MCL1125603.1 hypothetical protein [Shewanella surugensis]